MSMKGDIRFCACIPKVSSAAVLAMSFFCGAAYSESIPLVHEHGTLQVPAVINGKSLFNFTIDSGATDVSIPANVFFTLTRAGTVSPQDFLDKRAYKLADGSTEFSQRFRIRSLRVGSLELRDVIASVVPSAGSLLLGQSFLSRLRSWSIDNERQVLVLAEVASPRSALIVPRVSDKNGKTGWERLSDLHDPKGVLFLDTASFQSNGNLRWFSDKHVFPPHTATWLGKWVNYSVDHWEFDCRNKKAKLDARSDTYEDGTLWVADAHLLSSTAWHSVQGDAWKESEMNPLCERVRPDTFSRR
jgi:clan AA aspartic protease (TIGR02281 family)